MISTKADKIFVAGHRGLVGSAILANLKSRGYSQILTRTRQELDLLDQAAVYQFLKSERPQLVFVAAAKVGGILANNIYRAEFIYENLQIQNNLIWGAHLAGVPRLVFLGSSCIYPRLAAQPMSEMALLTGPLEYTNRPYAIAKIAGLELVNTLRQQFGRDYFSVMPTNLYGPGDNFHPENSHVLAALVRRFCDAQQAKAEEVVVWGTGAPRREFMYSADCASAIVFLAESLSKEQIDASEIARGGWSHINVGTGQEVTIRDLAHMIADLAGYKGRISFDTSKPDGTERKLLDCRVLHDLGWQAPTNLKDGLLQTISYYRSKYQ